MKCSAWGVFALGLLTGSAAALSAAAMDPAIRRRMCGKAACAGHRMIRTCKSWMN